MNWYLPLKTYCRDGRNFGRALEVIAPTGKLELEHSHALELPTDQDDSGPPGDHDFRLDFILKSPAASARLFLYRCYQSVSTSLKEETHSNIQGLPIVYVICISPREHNRVCARCRAP